MYTINKAARIKEALCIHTEDGDVVLDVDLDPATMAANIEKSCVNLAELKGLKNATLDQLNGAIDALLVIVFGEAGKDTILDIYDGNRAAALEDLTPFIQEAVLPRVASASKARAKSYRRVR